MESQLQNPEFRNNPENFHPCAYENPVDIKPYYHIFGTLFVVII